MLVLDPRQFPARKFELAPSPRLTIGTDIDAPGHTLSGVAGAFRTADGRIILGDDASRQIRFFKSDGSLERVVGREGAGAGEFRAMNWLGRCPGDTVAVQDPALNRVSFYSPDGRFVRSTPLPIGYNGDAPIACYSGGVLLIAVTQPRYIPPGNTLVRTPAMLVRVRPGSTRVDTVASYQGNEYFFSRRAGGYVEQPFGKVFATAVGHRFVFAAPNDLGRIDVFDTSGLRRREILVAAARRNVTADDMQRATAERLIREHRVQTRQLLSGVLADVKPPSVFPAFESLAADSDDRLWIKLYDTSAIDGSAWVVVSVDGQAIGTAILPRRLRILEIGRGHILGVVRDADETEQVRLYDIAITQ